MTPEEIRAQAEKEIFEEDFREKVDACKEKLRQKKWWHGLFPWRIIIVRRDV